VSKLIPLNLYLRQMQSSDKSATTNLTEPQKCLSSKRQQWNHARMIAVGLPLVFGLLSPQIARADCPIGGGIADPNISTYISGEVYGGSTNALSKVDDLDNTWRTAAGLPQTGTVIPWFPRTPASSSLNSFMTNGVTTSVQLIDLDPAGISCTGTPAIGSPFLANSSTLQSTSPRPSILHNSTNQPNFWNENTGDTKSRNAVLFSFDRPVSSFGAWFGDLETRKTIANGTPAILRLLDASGNRIGNDISIDPTDISNGGTFTVLDQSTCNSSSNGCGNNSTRWVGFVDTSSVARVSKALVIVGDAVLGGDGKGEHLSFIGADILPSISGTVFEDPNYGGGAGRKFATAGTSPRPNATVELYNKNTGAFIAATTTNFIGTYTFTGVNLGDYLIRVVNSTITSSRGVVAGLIPVQTFRVNDSNGNPIEDPHRVGGENPSTSDTGAAGSGAVLNSTSFVFITGAGTAITGGQAESIAPVKVGSSNVTGIDFGYNFDTIVNTNDSNQGSLRQFIINSNALHGEASLAQLNQPTGKETSIFMIPGGSAVPGIRAGVVNQLTNGVAVINVATALPIIIDSNTSIDGKTQTTNIGNTNTGLLGTGGSVGVNNIPLAQVNKPEVELTDGGGTVGVGLNIQGDDTTVRGLSIWGFGAGNSTPTNNQITIGLNPPVFNPTPNRTLIEQNILGTQATGFSQANAPGFNTASNNGEGIYLLSSADAIIRTNLIGFNGGTGILSFGNNLNLTVSGNEIRSNGITNTRDGVGLENGTKNSQAINNLIINNAANGVKIDKNGANSQLLVDNNTIQGSGVLGWETAGIAAVDTAASKDTISRNTIAGSKGAGIWLETTVSNTKITQNSIYQNAGLGIDLKGGDGGTGNQTIIGTTTVNPNDGAVSTSIANNGIDYPIVTASTLNSETLTVKGFVGNVGSGSTKFAGAKLEFFIADNSDANQNGLVILGDGKSKPHGEGKTYIGTCTTDANSLFNCTFSNAGTLGLTDANNITATAIDALGNTSEFSAVPSIKANVLAVKRITAINGQAINPNDNTPLNTIIDNPATTNDNNPNWPNGLLIGAYDAGKVRPGDKIEYTVYFMNANGADITNVKMCDPIIGAQTFLNDAYGAGKDIKYKFGSNPEVSLTRVVDPDVDRAQFNPSPGRVPGCTASTLTGTNNGTVVIDVTGSGSSIQNNISFIPGATGPSTADSYGYFRFITTVKP
jgi:parallel beta-helix repeat protein